MKKICVMVFVLLLAVLASGANEWSVLNHSETGGRTGGALFYQPDSNVFFLLLGYSNDSSAYSDLMYSERIGKWINHFPHDTLYGVWGDSTGQTRGLGKMGNPVFSSPYNFVFQNVSWGGKTFLRPNLHEQRRSYSQYAFNTTDGKMYAHYKGITCSYNTRTRTWDTINAMPHPSSSGSAAYMRFGFMAHDPINNEVLIAGGAIDKRDGWSGVWALSPVSRTWVKQNGLVEPTPRAYASVATDPVRGKIVVFGGDHLDYLMNDTWVYDCATKSWEKKVPAVAPSPRAGAVMVYAPNSGKIVLLGGFEYTSCTGYGCAIYRQIPSYEMWTYDIDANTWTLNKRFSAGERIPAVRIPDVPSAAADSGDRIMLLGSSKDTTYILTYDPQVVDPTNTAILGKRDTTHYRLNPWRVEWFDEGVTAPDTSATETALRNLTPNVWTLVSPPKKPASNHDWGTTVFDSDRDGFILFSGGHSAHCGNEVDEYSVSTNRWKISYAPEWPLEETYNSGLPFLFSFSGRPMVTHSYDNYCYDTVIHKMVYIKPNYTFFYNPDVADWDSVIPNPAQFTTDYHHISVNQTSHGSVAWVRSGNGGSTYALYTLDYDSLRWRLLPRTGAVLPSSYGDNAGAAYDSKRDRLIMVYGTTTADPVMVSYSFATGIATSIIPANNASARTSYMRECVYVPEFDRLVFGAEIDGKLLAFNCETEVWEFLEVTRPSSVSSFASRSVGLMYDARRNLLWYHNATSMVTGVLKLTSEAFPNGTVVENSEIISGKELLYASPNPFNPSSTIRFAIPSAGVVSLGLYSTEGKLVKSVLSEKYVDTGIKSVELNSHGLSTGTYVLRLDFGRGRLTKRIVLIK